MLIWKVKSENVNVASLRYRSLIPVKYLNARGYDSLIYSNQDEIKFSLKPEAIVFVKSFAKHDLKLAQKARQKGIPIILDICDNIFVEGYAAHSKSNPADIFKEMAKIASAIVTTGIPLKSFIESCIDSPIPIFIIPDASETLLEFKDYGSLLKENQKFKNRVSQLEKLIILLTEPKSVVFYLKSQLKHTLIGKKNSNYNIKPEKIAGSPKYSTDEQDKRHPLQYIANTDNREILFNSSSREMIVDKYRNKANDLKQVIWFGSHGIKFGQKLFKLLDVIPELIEAYQEINFCLHIVSEAEAYEVYQKYIQPLPLPTKFTRWNQYINYHSISQSHVTIIPNSLDAFEICKSPNRAILSLALGVPVVATKTPALLPFEDCIIFDNWQQGIVSYLKDPDLVFKHITTAQSIIKRDYSGEVIADKWTQIIDKIGHKSWTKYLIDNYVKF
jgi:hypothetical protein